jgi:hypothetical protein
MYGRIPPKRSYDLEELARRRHRAPEDPSRPVAHEPAMRRSDDDLLLLVSDPSALPEPLRSHVDEVRANPKVFQRRAAAIEIAISYYNATLMAVLDKDLDNITRLTAPLTSLDEPTRVAVGEALEWWSQSDEETRAEYLQHQRIVVNQIAGRVA